MANFPRKLLNNYKSTLKDTLRGGMVGFEKESLRVIESKIAKTPHPSSLGSALCNKYITTDFSEAQLEIISPPLSDRTKGLKFLDHIHQFISSNLEDEILWPLSMPPPIESDNSVPIANYGTSNLGLFKQIYRNGLSHRYGNTMQAISGLHFNFSLPESFFNTDFFEEFSKTQKLDKTAAYLNMLRNVFRMNWFVLYLFGASPILTNNYLKSDAESFRKLSDQTYYLPYATSLRMSNYGYRNLSRGDLYVSLNSIDQYIAGLRSATNTVNPDFLKIENNQNLFLSQLNSNILQIEDEYYAVARAKSNIDTNERTSSKLAKNGIDYVELRSIDLNPFESTGIDYETVIFLEAFLIYCFLNPSEIITDSEFKTIQNNELSVAKYGRDPNLTLNKGGEKTFLSEWAYNIIDDIQPIVELIDDKRIFIFFND